MRWSAVLATRAGQTKGRMFYSAALSYWHQTCAVINFIFPSEDSQTFAACASQSVVIGNGALCLHLIKQAKLSNWLCI